MYVYCDYTGGGVKKNKGMFPEWLICIIVTSHVLIVHNNPVTFVCYPHFMANVQKV